MKKSAIKLFIIICIIIAVLASCRERIDTGKMLGYQKNSEYDVVFSLGEYKYPMHLSLDNNNEAASGNGRATMTGGVLEGVVFDMQSGVLKMIVDELEYTLDQGDCIPLHALFACFAIKENEFVGVTSENGSSILEARFNGLYDYTVFLNESDFSPIKITAQTDKGICIVEFENKELSEKAE